MPTVKITLSEPEKAFVDTRVRASGLGSASEYIALLVQMEQLKEHKDKIEPLLLEGLNSGPTAPMTKQDWEDIRREAKARLATERKYAAKRAKKSPRPKRPA